MGKKFWASKTFWTNLMALGALVVQGKTGYIMDPEEQMALLGVANLALRFITKEPIAWTGGGQ